MKRALHNTNWRLTDKGEFCGVDFGYEFCAEHEMGIRSIRDSFGIKSYTGNSTINFIKKFFGDVKPTLGIEARTITQVPPSLIFKQKVHFCGMCFTSSPLGFSDELFESKIKDLAWENAKPNGKDLCTYWSDTGFMLITTNQLYFQELKKAFDNLNIAIFGSKGLVICLPDRLDDRTKTEMYSSDLNAWELRKKSEEVGIEKELIKAKKEFYALNPNWKNPATKEIHWWLNPKDQRENNYGWFTAEELREWIKGTGPVVKERKITIIKK